MPSTSRETASDAVRFEGVDIRLEHLEGGYSVCFERHAADGRLTEVFRGLPDDRSPLPRWGYVIRGRIGFRFGDREEVYESGEAYYAPPGHTVVHHAGTEIVEFSPTDVLRTTFEVVAGNLRRSGVALDTSDT